MLREHAIAEYGDKKDPKIEFMKRAINRVPYFWGIDDEIRFDIIYGAVRPKVRRVFRILFSIFIVGIYAASLPDVLSYISFMKIEKTAYMKIPFSYVFSVFAIFTAVTILRYGWILIKELRGQGPEDDNPDLTQVARKDFSE